MAPTTYAPQRFSHSSATGGSATTLAATKNDPAVTLSQLLTRSSACISL